VIEALIGRWIMLIPRFGYLERGLCDAEVNRAV